MVSFIITELVYHIPLNNILSHPVCIGLFTIVSVLIVKLNVIRLSQPIELGIVSKYVFVVRQILPLGDTKLSHEDRVCVELVLWIILNESL